MRRWSGSRRAWAPSPARPIQQRMTSAWLSFAFAALLVVVAIGLLADDATTVLSRSCSASPPVSSPGSSASAAGSSSCRRSSRSASRQLHAEATSLASDPSDGGRGNLAPAALRERPVAGRRRHRNVARSRASSRRRPDRDIASRRDAAAPVRRSSSSLSPHNSRGGGGRARPVYFRRGRTRGDLDPARRRADRLDRRQIQADDPDIDALIATPHRLLAFRTFAYVRVGLLLGQLLFDAATCRRMTARRPGWTQLLRDPKHHDAAERPRGAPRSPRRSRRIRSTPMTGRSVPTKRPARAFREFARKRTRPRLRSGDLVLN